ncbi:MAG TPA: Asp23/Gls24 family envelope stress response protein [Gaiellaceae bacterium]|nr:Asp23/Gls24 family envelope stress response protein [Gaiellaceae bacterium]
MAGEASISSDILARYAADAAREVPGVRGLSESPIPGRRGVRIGGSNGEVRVELHLAVDWGTSIPELGRDVQQRVRDYLQRMADIEPAVVDVVVDEVGPRP